MRMGAWSMARVLWQRIEYYYYYTAFYMWCNNILYLEPDMYLKDDEMVEDQQSTEQQITQPITPTKAFLVQPQPEVKTSSPKSSRKNPFIKFLLSGRSKFKKKSTLETSFAETSLATKLEDDPDNIVGHFNTPETGEFHVHVHEVLTFI